MGYSSHRLVEPLLRRHGRAVVEDVRVASHEAAHAILRWAGGRGRSIGGISIEPREIEGRKINGRVWSDSREVENENDYDYFARIIELVGGSVGEDIALGQTRGLRGSDRRKAHRNASALCESPDAIQHLIDAAEAEAAFVLRENAHILDALASALCERRTMTGEEALAIINHAASLTGSA